MSKFTFLKTAAVALGLLIPGMGLAGNVPQYSFSTSENYYESLSGATAIPLDFSRVNGKAVACFANGSMTQEAQTAKGFDIGFDFVFAGTTVNQFVPSSNGVLFFGKDYVKIESEPNLALQAGDHMGYVNLHAGFSPAEYGIIDGSISYKTEGAEGEKVTTVQFANMTLDEDNQFSSNRGVFNLQIRLFQADNHIEFAWTQVHKTLLTSYLYCGLHGWDSKDGLMIYGNTVSGGFAVSPFTSGQTSGTQGKINWDNYNPGGNTVQHCFVFTPSDNKKTPVFAPGGLNAVVEEDGLNITCRRGKDSEATVILVSEEPFDETKMPKDGVTFPIKTFSRGDTYITSFGKAKAIYYGSDEEVSVVYPNVKPATKYYVRAIAASGYPCYNLSNAANFVVSAANNPPENVSVASGNASLTLSWDCDVDVIVAMSTVREANPKYPYGNRADFGAPDKDTAVGDELQGGGKVVYIGSEKEFTLMDAPKNQMVYFALWSKDGELISKTYANAYGVTNPTLPYEPKLEERALMYIPTGWSSSDNLSYSVQKRPGDGEYALYGFSEMDSPTLESPLLPLEKETVLTFDWALETASSPTGQTQYGTVPGFFGTSATSIPNDNQGLFVKVGDQMIDFIQEYIGEMKMDGGAPIRGTSEFIPFEVNIPAQGKHARISISFCTYLNSELWLRNLKLVDKNPIGIDGIAEENVLPMLFSGEGEIIALGDGASHTVYRLDGSIAARYEAAEGTWAHIALPAGVYIVNGYKLIVR